MSEDTGEPKHHEASASKLRKARRRGQIAKSANFVENFRVIFLLPMFAFMAMSLLPQKLHSLFDVIVLNGETLEEGTGYNLLVPIGSILNDHVLILVISSIAVVAVHALSVGGLPISAHPMAPSGSKVSPAKNLKKIFTKRHVLEFVMSWIWSMVWLATAMVLIWSELPALLFNVTCIVDCTSVQFIEIAIVIFTVLILILIIAAIVDLIIQKKLFALEMRMTTSEYKRDRRDTETDSNIKSEIRQRASDGGGQGAQSMRSAANQSWERATCLLIGKKFITGIRYNPDDDPPFPYVVQSVPLAQMSGDLAQELVGLDLQRIDHAPVADKIGTTVLPGSVVPKEHLLELMQTLYRAGVI